MERSQNILNLIILLEFVYELATLTLSVFTITFVRIETHMKLITMS